MEGVRGVLQLWLRPSIACCPPCSRLRSARGLPSDATRDPRSPSRRASLALPGPDFSARARPRHPKSRDGGAGRQGGPGRAGRTRPSMVSKQAKRHGLEALAQAQAPTHAQTHEAATTRGPSRDPFGSQTISTITTRTCLRQPPLLPLHGTRPHPTHTRHHVCTLRSTPHLEELRQRSVSIARASLAKNHTSSPRLLY